MVRVIVDATIDLVDADDPAGVVDELRGRLTAALQSAGKPVKYMLTVSESEAVVNSPTYSHNANAAMVAAFRDSAGAPEERAID